MNKWNPNMQFNHTNEPPVKRDRWPKSNLITENLRNNNLEEAFTWDIHQSLKDAAKNWSGVDIGLAAHETALIAHKPDSQPA